jgi:3-dehydro-L-gulonate 2-dehydrogenase
MGYWKGSGFAILLDLVASLLAGGRTTAGMDKFDKGSCGSCCQVFIAIDPLRFNSAEFVEQAINETISQLRNSIPATANSEILYPGEQSLRTRMENLELGIPVDDGIWERVKQLAKI